MDYVLYWIIGGISLLITMGAQGFIKSTYSKYSTVMSKKGMTGAETARVNFKMTMPKLQSPDFKSFMEAAKHLKDTGVVKFVKTYSDDDIEKVKTGGIIGAMANEIIKRQHGKNAN
jgi:hypothetical protein